VDRLRAAPAAHGRAPRRLVGPALVGDRRRDGLGRRHRDGSLLATRARGGACSGRGGPVRAADLSASITPLGGARNRPARSRARLSRLRRREVSSPPCSEGCCSALLSSECRPW
jgi:hypothetical protein